MSRPLPPWDEDGEQAQPVFDDACIAAYERRYSTIKTSPEYLRAQADAMRDQYPTAHGIDRWHAMLHRVADEWAAKVR